MLSRVKSNVERELRNFAEDFGRPPLSALPRRFSETFGQFVQRDGKRLRAVLFVTGYRGYSARTVRNLYKSAAALELGYFAGNLHWRVRFEGERLLVALEGPEEDYLSRLKPFLDVGRARRAERD